MSKHEPQPRFTDDDAFFTRGELCKALGIGKTTLRHWETAGKANPVLNANGVWLYSREEAERLTNGKQVSPRAKARAHVPSARGAEGELAAKIFDRLDREVHPVEIVKELTVHPDIVEGFVARWARMRRTIVLTVTDVTALAKALRGNVGDTRELLSAIQILAGRARLVCEHCEGTRPTACGKCMAAHLRGAVLRTERRMACASESSSGSRAKPFAEDRRRASSIAPRGSATSRGGTAAPPTEAPPATTSGTTVLSVTASSASPRIRVDGVISDGNGGGGKLKGAVPRRA